MQLKLEKPWEQVKDKIKEQDKTLTDYDLRLENGNDDDVLERLSAKMGRSKEHVKEWIESLSFND